MPDTYQDVESRIKQALEALSTRPDAKLCEIAVEFHVPLGRLRSRQAGAPSKSEVRGLHNRALKPDQELALHMYLSKLDQIGASARIHMVRKAVNVLIQQTWDSPFPPHILNAQWAK